MSAAIQVIDNPKQAAVLMQPLRIRILEELQEPNSSAGLARILKIPRQKVNYHLRELESGGYLKLVEERKSGNVNERILVSQASTYLVSPDVLGKLGDDPEEVRDRFSLSALLSAAAKIIRDLARIRRAADKKNQRVPTLSLSTTVRFRSAAERKAYSEALIDSVAKLNAKYHDESAPKGRSFNVITGIYPEITRDLEEG